MVLDERVTTRVRLRAHLGPVMAALAVAGGMATLPAAAQAESPAVTAFTVPSPPTSAGSTAAITIAPDSSGEFFELAGATAATTSTLWKVTTAGTITEASTSSTGGFPETMVVAAGDVWSIHNNHAADSSTLNAFSPSGGFAGSLAESATQLIDLSVGPDGNLYATDPDGDILRFTVTGGAMPTASGAAATDALGDSQPIAITTAGSQIWFSDGSGNLLTAPFGTSGFGGPFSAGLLTPSTHTLVAGADGNLYAAGGGTGAGGGTAILQIDPTAGAGNGTVTKTFTLPTGDTATSITSGPDGNIWFTDDGTESIGQLVLSSGAVTEFPLPSGYKLPPALSVSIQPGPTNTLWYSAQTSVGAPAIGEVTGVTASTGTVGGTGPTGTSGATGPTGGTTPTGGGTTPTGGGTTPTGGGTTPTGGGTTPTGGGTTPTGTGTTPAGSTGHTGTTGATGKSGKGGVDTIGGSKGGGDTISGLGGSSASVGLGGGKAHVSGKGVAEILLHCTGGACKGHLTLVYSTPVTGKGKKHKGKPTTLGTGSFTLKSGKSGTFALKLSKHGYSMLLAAAGHKLSATLKVTLSGGGGASHSLTLIG